MKDKQKIRVFTEAICSEHCDRVSHAVISLDLSDLEFIEKTLKEVQQLKLSCFNFSSMNFRHDGAEFFDLSSCGKVKFEDASEGEPELLSSVDDCLSCGEIVYVPLNFSIPKGSLAAIRPMSLRIKATEFYWYGWDKHVGMSCYAETASFNLVDLMQWKTKLSGQLVPNTSVLFYDGMTYRQLLAQLNAMKNYQLEQSVAIIFGDDIFASENSASPQKTENVVQKQFNVKEEQNNQAIIVRNSRELLPCWGCYGYTPKNVIDDLDDCGISLIEAIRNEQPPYEISKCMKSLRDLQVKYKNHGADDTEGRSAVWELVKNACISTCIDSEKFWDRYYI